MPNSSPRRDTHDAGETEPIRIWYRGDGDVTWIVVEAVSALLETDPTSLEPLYHTVDTELLNDLCRGRRGLSGEVSFVYYGFRFTVTTDRRITIRPDRRPAGSDDGLRTLEFDDGTEDRE